MANMLLGREAGLLSLLLWILTLFHNAETVAEMEGDVTIAGLFTIKDNCYPGSASEIDITSVMLMETARWYIDALNKAGDLPLKLGFRGYATCGNTSIAGDHAVDILTSYRNAKEDSNSSDAFIIGLIGPHSSAETQVVSSVLSSQSSRDWLLQIGYSATATVLNNRQLYPNFYRVIPDDSIQVNTMVLLMEELEWNRIAIVYENDAYGRNGADDLRRLAEKQHICISKEKPITAGFYDSVEITETIRSLIINQPKVEGVVFFGSKGLAKLVILLTDRLRFKDDPIFLFSESNQLQIDVFQFGTPPSIIPKAKGSLTVSPPYDKITTFNDHWKSLFTNTTRLHEAAKENPYLYDAFKQYSGCDILKDGSNCSAMSSADIDKVTPLQSVFVKYDIIAVHTVAKAFQSVYNGVCENRKCDTPKIFKERFNPNMMLKAMNGLDISFQNDFSVDVNPLSDNNLTASFNESVNLICNIESTSYEAYNFRKLHTNTATFGFVKIGEIVRGNLSITTEEIRDYDSDGHETAYPHVRKGQCPADQKCSECLTDDLTEYIMHKPGDIYVIGFCSINNRAIPGPQGCGDVRKRHGYQLYLAMEYGLVEFTTSDHHSKKMYRDKFGNKKIGLIVLNACNNPLEIVRKILELHKHGLMLKNGERLDLNGLILGYIGGQSTDVSQPASDQLTRLGIVQISYSSTNPSLSDVSRFPYFMRIVTPDNIQGQAMINVVKKLNGKYIQMVYSEGAYGEGGRDSVIAAAKANEVCIAQILEVKESDKYHGYYELLRRKPHAKIVIVFLRSHVSSPFLRYLDIDMNSRKGEYQFIGSEAWGRNSEILEYAIIQGSITVSLEMDKNDDLETFIKDQLPTQTENNGWLRDYIQNRQDCYFSWSFDKTFSKKCTDDDLPTSDSSFQSDPWCIFATNSMLSLLKGAAVFYEEKCGSTYTGKLCQGYIEDPKGLVEEIKKIKLDIYGTGNIKIYDSVGDGSMGYKIFNIQNNVGDLSTRQYVEVGSFNIETGLTLHVNQVKYPTSEVLVSSCPNDQACADCTIKPNVTDVPPSTSDVKVPVLAGLLALSILVIVGIITYLVLKDRRLKNRESTYITPAEATRDADDNHVNDCSPGHSNANMPDGMPIELDYEPRYTEDRHFLSCIRRPFSTNKAGNTYITPAEARRDADGEHANDCSPGHSNENMPDDMPIELDYEPRYTEDPHL